MKRSGTMPARAVLAGMLRDELGLYANPPANEGFVSRLVGLLYDEAGFAGSLVRRRASDSVCY